MKAIILLTLVFSFNASFAGNWRAFKKQETTSTYYNQSDCERIEEDVCFEITGKNIKVMKIEKVDDMDRPNFRSVNDSPVKIDCKNFRDCAFKAFDPDDDQSTYDNVCASDSSNPRWAKASDFENVEGVSGPWFIWCSKLDGTYRKKDILVEDADKKAQYDAEQAAKQQVKVIEVEGDKAISVGKKAKKIMVGYIKLKKLPKSQRKALRGSLKSIIEALDVGSIDLAIDEIKALTEDGVVVTPESKALILNVFKEAGYDITYWKPKYDENTFSLVA